MEAFSFLVLFVAVALCFAGLLSAGSNDDDDQALRFKDTSGPFAVAVFAAPDDPAIGPSAFSVLVQNRATQDVLIAATVDATARPARGSQGMSLSARANKANSSNKLLQTAEVNLPAQGDWIVDIEVAHHSDTVHFSVPIHVVTPEAGIEFPWFYVSISTLSVILLAVYLGRRRSLHAERATSA